MLKVKKQVDVEKKPSIVKVQIGYPNKHGKFEISFSRPIKLPSSCNEWGELNEGAERLVIKIIKSEETMTLEYNQDEKLTMNWQIGDNFQTGESRRFLQNDADKDPNRIIKVS